MESKLLNNLAEKGCCIEKMLHETFMDMEGFYEKMLRRLPESTALARLRSAYEAGDVNAAFDAAHELKGLYANLGLSPARDRCSEIVEILRPRSDFGAIGELLPGLEAVHAELLSVIASS